MTPALKFGVPIVVGLIVLVTFLRSGHFLRSVFGSVLCGGASLLSVNILGALTGVTIAINKFTLCTVGLLGLPGTISLVLCDMIFRLH